MAEFPCQPESTNRRLQSILDLLSSAGYADAHKPDITAPEKLAGGLALCVAALNPPNSQIDVVVSSESLPHEDNKYATRFSLPLSLHLLSPSASMRRSSFPMTAYVCATMVGRKSKRLWGRWNARTLLKPPKFETLIARAYFLLCNGFLNVSETAKMRFCSVTCLYNLTVILYIHLCC